MLDLSDKLGQLVLRLLAQVVIHAVDIGGLVAPLGNFGENFFFLSNTLVPKTLSEELVEVETVLAQESDSRGAELLNAMIQQALGGGPHIKVKRPHRVSLKGVVPLVGAEAELEGVHASAGVLQLLVSALQRLVVVRPVLLAHEEPRELRVVGNEVGGAYGP